MVRMHGVPNPLAPLASLMSLGLLLLAAACGSNGSSSGNPCDVVPTPPSCNLACSPEPGAPNSCPEGLFCSPDGRCFAQCTAGGGDECGDGYTCTDDGRCKPDEQPPGPDAMPCPRVNFAAKPITPSILLLIDRSDSMLSNFEGMTRWNAIKAALIDETNGVVTQLQSKVFFGAMIYYTVREPNPVCPLLTVRPRALNNAAVIRDVLAIDPTYSWTPTAKSIEAAVASFAATPPPEGSLPYIVLATDGAPSTCNELSDAEKSLSVAAAAASFAAGIPLIPLSVANGVDAQHLQDVANAGAGVTAGQANAPLYQGNSPAALKAAFDTIIRGVVSCDLTISGTVTEDQAAEAQVLLNGQPITFGTDWVLVGGNTIRLVGATCTALKNAPMPSVNGTFPCGVVIE